MARMSSIIGAIAIGELVKSTLGPKGMDKILVAMGRNEGQVYNHHDRLSQGSFFDTLFQSIL